MKKIILVTLALLSTQLMGAYAVVSKIGTMNTNQSSALIEIDTTNPDGCTDALASKTLILALTDNTKSQYAVLLSAKVSDQQVRIIYDGCLSNIPNIIRVDI